MQNNLYATTKYATTTGPVYLDRRHGCHKTGAIMAGHDNHALHRQNPTSPRHRYLFLSHRDVLNLAQNSLDVSRAQVCSVIKSSVRCAVTIHELAGFVQT